MSKKNISQIEKLAIELLVEIQKLKESQNELHHVDESVSGREAGDPNEDYKKILFTNIVGENEIE